jgi:DNA topoisomerase IA
VPAALQVEQFVAQEYWSIDVAVGLGGKATQLPARLTHLDGSKVQQMSISNEDQASEVAGRVRAASYSVRRAATAVHAL